MSFCAEKTHERRKNNMVKIIYNNPNYQKGLREQLALFHAAGFWHLTEEALVKVTNKARKRLKLPPIAEFIEG